MFFFYHTLCWQVTEVTAGSWQVIFLLLPCSYHIFIVVSMAILIILLIFLAMLTFVFNTNIFDSALTNLFSVATY